MKWLILIYSPLMVMALPKFDESAKLQNILVPTDTAVNSAIYRLKAYDTFFDYPLIFKLGEINNVVKIESLNCTRFNSICQANVILKIRLEVGRIYDFSVSVSNSKGDSDVMQCSFRATNATTPTEIIFPGAPSLLIVSEAARRNYEIGSLRVRGKHNGETKPLLELYGPFQFGLRQKLIGDQQIEGTIWLLHSLDYEKSPSHHVIIFANDPWTDTNTDTRNIASWPIFISVLDEQDTPPVFTQAPPTTLLNPKSEVGDVILTVHAKDGDRGNPREIRYFLLSNNTVSHFFELLENTGELILIKPMSDLIASVSPKTPILLTIRADEMRQKESEPAAQSSSVQIALIPPPSPESIPQFSSKKYITTLSENSPPGKKLVLENATITSQVNVFFTLELLNNNETFDIIPKVANGGSNFTIIVKNNSLLDYESRHTVECDIVAKEIRDRSVNLSATAHLIVHLENVNDNTLTFRKIEWETDLPEHAEVGASVVKVEIAEKILENSNVRYTKIYGPRSDSFQLNADTGLITVVKSDSLDTGIGNKIKFFIEATDNQMVYNTATATVIINLIDINDKRPIFEKDLYEFILDENRNQFTVPAFVKAVDNDTTSPNNKVRYELIEQIDNITLNTYTGEITINNTWTKSNITTVHVRAYDGGIPKLSSNTEIKLYPPENKYRQVLFVVPGKKPNKEDIARTLTAIVGDIVVIDEIRPYNENDRTAADIGSPGDKSVVVATVPNSLKAVVDIQKIQQMLDEKTVGNESIIERAEGPNLWWLFWFLLLLILIIALTVILCCMCECCPWYVPPRKKKQTLSSKVTKLILQGSGQGKESKSVQVAEWFGRREAWTPEAVHIDNETDSLKRYELEKGSEKGGAKRHLRPNHATQDTLPRDQLYMREGNADILKLITRGNEHQRPVTFVQEQPNIMDNGKNILLKRFIDQQQRGDYGAAIPLPNAVNKLQAENEMLEASLKHQNILLRQILMEREREMRLETQSLPAGTQTDHDACTQTEPIFLRPPKRRTRSDNDASDYSDDEEETFRRRYRKADRMPMKRKITTPIQEESDSNMDPEKQQKSETRLNFGHTRTSILRKNAAQKVKSRSALRREVLREISVSLLSNESKRGSLSDDSLDEHIVSKRKSLRKYSDSSRSDSQKNKSYSVSDLRSERRNNKTEQKSQSHSDISQKPVKTRKRSSSSRYMEWYKNVNSNKSHNAEDSTVSLGTSRTSINTSKKNMGDTQTQMKNDTIRAINNGPIHPLIQHSQHRFETIIPRRLEDDVDLDIILTRPAMTEKKSIFTIAYEDIQTRQLRQDSATSPL